MRRLTAEVHNPDTMAGWVAHFQQAQFNRLAEAEFRQAVIAQIHIDKARYGWRDPGAAEPTPAPGTFVLGRHIARALDTATAGYRFYYPTSLFPAYGSSAASTVYVDQEQRSNGAYVLLNNRFQDCSQEPARSSCPFNPYVGFQNLQIQLTTSFQDGRIHLGEYLTATIDLDIGGSYASQTLLRANPIETQPDRRYPKSGNLHEWRAVNQAEPWFVQLQIQPDDQNPGSELHWKQCWHVRLPNLLRMVCKPFAVQTSMYGESISWGPGWVIDDGAYGLRRYGQP